MAPKGVTVSIIHESSKNSVIARKEHKTDENSAIFKTTVGGKVAYAKKQTDVAL